MKYQVTWTIELEADSPEEAARYALEIQRDEASTATVFVVGEMGGESSQEIDAAEV